jgi:uncharacterized membrane protein
MIRVLLALLSAAIAAAFAIDRWLSTRRGTPTPEPIRMEVVVDAPIADTWSVLKDIPLQREWMREMIEVNVNTPGPVAVGTKAESIVRIFGIPAPDPVEVVEFEPPTRYAIRHTGWFKGGGVITLEPGAGDTATTVRWEESLLPPVLPNLGAPVMAAALQPVFQADLERFKRLVETGSVDEA